MQLQQQARHSIFISCLSLVSQDILKKNLQTVQIESKKLIIYPSSSCQQKQIETKYAQPQLQQLAKHSIFIRCLSLVDQGILDEDLQTVQIESNRMVVDFSSSC